MKKILITFSTLFLLTQLFGQGMKPILETSDATLSLEQRTLNFDKSQMAKINARSFEANYHAIPNFRGNEFLQSYADVLQRDKNGQASFIKAELAQASRSLKSDVQLIKYIEQLAPVMELKPEHQEFELLSEWKDELDQVHFKLQQKWNGIPIYGAEILIHSENGLINSLNGNYLTSVKLKAENSIPVLHKKDAKEIVIASSESTFVEFSDRILNLSKEMKQWEDELVYYQDEDKLTLAYHIKMRPNIGEWKTFFVDAMSGEIISEYSNICKAHGHNSSDPIRLACKHSSHNQNLLPDGPSTANAEDLLGNMVSINTYEFSSTFFMMDGSRPMFDLGESTLPYSPVGAIVVYDAMNNILDEDFQYSFVLSSDNSWDAKESVSAQSNGSQAFEYFANTHNRNSIDGAGGTMISFVNTPDQNGESLGNAFWNGAFIFYGNGDSSLKSMARSLDIAGHEMTHGVIQNSANLEYQDESGAINESLADCFGAMIDREDWLLGEDVVRLASYPSGAMRDISNPANGAANGDYFGGYQPSHVDDQYFGELDHGGVHVNSGIPNYAFYLIATDIGKEKTEKIYYRALTNYLTKSSQFTDLRIAVVQAADDLYGNTEINVVKERFSQVGIGDAPSGNYQNDAASNPGSDLILYTTPDNDGIFLVNGEGVLLADPLSDVKIQSRPSITDDGSFIVFVGEDKKLYSIFIDWAEGTFSSNMVNDAAIWRNVIISKDGSRIAALSDNANNEIMVYDYGLEEWRDYELFNPTFTEGISTGDVLFADVMEFDLTSNYILYDSFNELSSASSESIRYWDMGFIKVWDEDEDAFSDGDILKPFPSLEAGYSIGNPTFSKNSPYIIAFDVFTTDNVRQVLGANLETGDVELIYNNTVLGFPSFSKDDDRIIFNVKDGSKEELGVVNLNADKISASQSSSIPWFFQNPTPSRWGVWFGNGDRVLSDVENVEASDSDFTLFPNPVNDFFTLSVNEHIDYKKIAVYNQLGELVIHLDRSSFKANNQIDVSSLVSGTYFISLISEKIHYNKLFVVTR